MERHQAEDGYLGDHVAATFHMVLFYRLIGAPTPKADRMIARVLRDQKPDGGWDIKAPDWDVHACFDAVFILRQLGGDDAKVRAAIARDARWALRCRNADGGFGHFPGRPSEDRVDRLKQPCTMSRGVESVWLGTDSREPRPERASRRLGRAAIVCERRHNSNARRSLPHLPQHQLKRSHRPSVNQARSSSGGRPGNPLRTARRTARTRLSSGCLRASSRSIATKCGERNRTRIRAKHVVQYPST
jgi:hypothetical protein